MFPQETSAAASAFGYDSSREKAILENPQIFQNCEIINILSSDYAQSARGAHSKSSCLQKTHLPPQVKIASGGKKDYTIKKPAVYRSQRRM